MIPGGATCLSCVFFNLMPMLKTGHNGDRLGQCRRIAPRVLTYQERVVTRWPLVEESEWCGEHAVPDGDA